MIEERIETLLQQKFQEDAFQDCFIVEIKFHPNNKLEVFIDSDTGVSFDTCRQISRHLEAEIDEQGWLGPQYVLEVSSPGVSRPLTLPRQYRKNIGRKLKVKLHEGGEQSGTLVQVETEHIVLEDKVRVKEGNKKVTKTVQTEIPFDQIKKAVVQVSF
ncbi:MAG: ribosome assembly cofactor RimP [Phaeodactylibacter sp.]|nr:ribosome assembly cofactor RimP [Phaeodactylibacter sp.]